MYPNSNKRKGGSCINIRVRFLGDFGDCVYPEIREGDDTSWKRRRRKEMIFRQVDHSTYLGVWGVMWDNRKHSCHNSNTLKF